MINIIPTTTITINHRDRRTEGMLLLLSTVHHHHHHWQQSLSTVIRRIPTIATTITITTIANFDSSISRDRRTEGMVVLDSKDAEWDKTLNSYVLNYHGRASQVWTRCIGQQIRAYFFLVFQKVFFADQIGLLWNWVFGTCNVFDNCWYMKRTLNP